MLPITFAQVVNTRTNDFEQYTSARACVCVRDHSGFGLGNVISLLLSTVEHTPQHYPFKLLGHNATTAHSTSSTAFQMCRIVVQVYTTTGTC
jgi:hypothetical protein